MNYFPSFFYVYGGGETYFSFLRVYIHGLDFRRPLVFGLFARADFRLVYHGNQVSPFDPQLKESMFSSNHTDYAETCGDKMPDVGRIALPSCMTKREVYKLYAEEERKKGKVPVSGTSFRRLWKAHFKNIFIPKVNFFWVYVILVLFTMNIIRDSGRSSNREGWIDLSRHIRTVYQRINILEDQWATAFVDLLTSRTCLFVCLCSKAVLQNVVCASFFLSTV